ncbi:MAG TPA: hypothetical protein VI112_03015, partial [Bacteroidia bacterium]
NASVTLSDAWSTFNNQAGLGFMKNIAVGTYYEDRFMLKQLSSKAFAFALPVPGGTFGLSYSSFGYSAYSENKYGLAFGKSFGENISAGIQMDYLTTHIIENYGSKGTLVAEAGMQFKVLKKLTMGVHVYNLTRSKLADYDNERVPTVMRLGLTYKFSDKVFVSVETEKDMDRKSVLKAGAEYMVAKVLYIRAGIASNPSLSCFGFGLNLKGFKIDITATYHSVLGFTPQMGLGYDLK